MQMYAASHAKHKAFYVRNTQSLQSVNLSHTPLLAAIRFSFVPSLYIIMMTSLSPSCEVKMKTTHLYFVRHAQPDESHLDDRSRPLTPLGLADRSGVTMTLKGRGITRCVSSPYKRAVDTIAPFCSEEDILITTDERLRERQMGPKASDFLEKRWADYSVAEEGGETINEVRERLIPALNDILDNNEGESVVIGFHGAALSIIMNYLDSSCGLDWFRMIHDMLPYIIRFDFEGREYLGSEELFRIERGY